jgi:bleomycin hydrolase
MGKFLIILLVFFHGVTYAQPVNNVEFNNRKTVAATPVKSQGMTGTCWCFSTTSLIESQCLNNKTSEIDLSEIYTVRNIYIEKAVNYILRQGNAQFGEGGLGHDLIRAISTYGAMPEKIYNGLQPNQKTHNHTKLAVELKKYLDSMLKTKPLQSNWLEGYKTILDDNLGVPPNEFEYNGKKYTPKSFADEALKFNANDYVNITSFTHHPFYEPFVLEVPDNFSNGSYYNLPLTEMIDVVKISVDKGFSIMWDADVSNNGFKQNKGFALFLDNTTKPDDFKADIKEQPYDQDLRQQLFMNLTTQDDHLMHIIGTEKSKDGKTFFIVKNSWGEVGPFKGYINVSEAYFAVNTVSLVVPKAALSKTLLNKLKIK